MAHKIITFDIETQNGLGNWRDFSGVKISVLGAIDQDGKEYVYWEDQLPDFLNFISDADLIVGFNSLGFDVPVLQNYTDINLKKYPHYDIMDEFKKIAGHRIKLDDLAQNTLGKGKSGSGLDALKYWAEGRHDELARYCMDDVRVTKALFDHVVSDKPVKYLNLTAPKEIILKKPDLKINNQNSLF